MKKILFALIAITFMLSAKAQIIEIKNTETDTLIYSPPEFIGGTSQMNRFFARTVRYPAIAKENNTQGQVIIQVIIETDGSLSDIKIIQSVSVELDREALRVIKLMPVWIPGNVNGKAVRSYYKIPFWFTLSKG